MAPYPTPVCPFPTTHTMRPIFLAFALVALFLFISPVSTSDSDSVAARDTVDAKRSPRQYRRNYAPGSSPLQKRQDGPPRPKPSTVFVKRDDGPWHPKPSTVYAKRDDGPWHPKPSPVYAKRDGGPWQPKPSPVYAKRDGQPWQPKPSPVYAKREGADHKRSLEEQNILENVDGLSWQTEDQCPAPLMSCPVPGSPHADAFECVDLLSDLDSCGGCAADDISCVLSPFLPLFLSPSIILSSPPFKPKY
jgi:hypothetical protein